MSSNPLKPRPTLRESLNEFFYREEVPFSLALLRILLPLVLLIVVVPRWVHSRELYSTDGAPAQLAVNYGWPEFLPEPSGTTAVALMSVLAVSLVTSAIGWKTRASLLISTVLFGYLNLLDCLSSITKYSVISTHLLLLLSLSECGAIWSVDSLLKPSTLPLRKVFGTTTALPIAPVWPRRLIQLLIGLIYFGAATTKLQTEAYFTSDQLRWWMMTNVNRANPLGEWLSLYPSILIVMGYAAIVWQIIFVVVCWRGIGRVYALGFGTTFHLSTGPLLGIFVFPMVMISSYVSFLDEKDMLRISRWIRSLLRGQAALRRFTAPLWETRQHAGHSIEADALPRGSRLNDASDCRIHPIMRPPKWAASGLAYATVLVVTSAAGVGAEYVIDPYGERRPEGKLPLQVLEAGFFEQIPQDPEAIREGDKFHTIAIGTQLLGGVMMDSRTEFSRGEKFLVQTNLTMLHGDQWIECNFHDPDGRLLQRNGQVVTRERMRAEWRYEIPRDLEPGTYWIVVRSSGEEIDRRPIVIR